MTCTIGLVPDWAETTKVKTIRKIDGRNDVDDYTSDSVINDLKVDSTTSLPVHNNAQNMSMVVNKVEEIRHVNIACQDRGIKGQKHNLKNLN